jgi:hypothetical protein
MKKILTVVAVTLLATTLSAQTRVGFRAGAGLSEVRFDPVSLSGLTIATNPADAIDFHAAIVLNMQIPGFLFIQPELQFNTISSKFNVTQSTPGSLKLSYSRTSLQIPLLVGFNIGFLKLNAGPVFNLTSNEETSINHLGVKIKSKKIPVGYQIGAGIKLGNMILEARYAALTEKSEYTFSRKGVTKTVTPKKDYQLLFSVGFLF